MHFQVLFAINNVLISSATFLFEIMGSGTLQNRGLMTSMHKRGKGKRNLQPSLSSMGIRSPVYIHSGYQLTSRICPGWCVVTVQCITHYITLVESSQARTAQSSLWPGLSWTLSDHWKLWTENRDFPGSDCHDDTLPASLVGAQRVRAAVIPSLETRVTNIIQIPAPPVPAIKPIK